MSIIPNFFGLRSNKFDPFSVDLWDPFEGSPFSRNFRSLSDPLEPHFPAETSALAQARIDWKETPTAHVFKADVPGLKKEEFKVEVEDGNVLQISGERNLEMEEKNDTWHRIERSSGKFMRRFRLPENAKVDQVKAAMEEGVLTVTVPKEEIKKADVKSIEGPVRRKATATDTIRIITTPLVSPLLPPPLRSLVSFSHLDFDVVLECGQETWFSNLRLSS